MITRQMSVDPKFGLSKTIYYQIVHRQQIWEIRKALWKHSYLTFYILEMDWFHPKRIVTLMQISRVSVMDEYYNLLCLKFMIHNRIYRNISPLNTSLKNSHKFRGIRHYFVNLWEMFVCLMIRYYHQLKFAYSHRITILVLYQNGRLYQTAFTAKLRDVPEKKVDVQCLMWSLASHLTYCGWDKMAIIFQTAFWNGFVNRNA